MGDEQTPVFEENNQDRPALWGVMGNERMNAFSDGVFSIAITLLAFSLQVPASAPAGLLQKLPALLPEAIGYGVSFFILGVYWVGHHNMMLHIKRHDRWLLWLNILFLMFVAAVPFVAQLEVRYPTDRIAVIAYALVLIGAGLALNLMWRYATHASRLTPPDMDPDLVGFVNRRQLMAPTAYLLAIVISFVSTLAAQLVFVVVPLLYIVPSPLDWYHHKQLGANEG